MVRTGELMTPRRLSHTALEPFGLHVEADRPGRGLHGLPVAEVRDLARREGVLVLRGFAPLSRDDLAGYASTWGEILTWDFGAVLELVVQAEPKNHLFTNGRAPVHWDGAFARAVPSFLLFQCLRAPLPGTGGETLFCHTSRLWDDATAEQRDRWGRLVLTYVTEKVAHYGGRITVPLAARHPVTGRPTLRYAEPPREGPAVLNPLVLEAPGLSAAELAALLDEVNAAVYDPRHCYAHAWQEGDFLVADNHLLLHGRRAFRSHSPRHLQRVQIL
jgi:alpha-ketoglutarate-dependent taurine dioxygenase